MTLRDTETLYFDNEVYKITEIESILVEFVDEEIFSKRKTRSTFHNPHYKILP